MYVGISHSVSAGVPAPADAVPTTVLVIDDDPDVIVRVRAALEAEGYRVQSAVTGREAQACLPEVRPNLILLEIMLPDVDGLLFCGTLQTLWPGPIIMLSNSPRRSDRILSLRMGADDFIPKPFHPYELAARVGAVLRRAERLTCPPSSPPQHTSVEGSMEPSTEPEVLRVGELLLDDRRHRAMVKGVTLDLTASEYRLLSIFAGDPGRAWSRDALGDVLGGTGDAGGRRAINVHISRLRSKLEPFGDHAPAIVTVRGFGYRLELPEGENARSVATI